MSSEDRKKIEPAQELTPEQLEDVTGGEKWFNNEPRGQGTVLQWDQCSACHDSSVLKIDPLLNHGMEYYCYHCGSYYNSYCIIDKNGKVTVI